MRRSLLVGIGFLFAGGLSCYDARLPVGPGPDSSRAEFVPDASCVTLGSGQDLAARLEQMLRASLSSSPNPTSAVAKLKSIVEASSEEAAQTGAVELMEFILRQFHVHFNSITDQAAFAEFTTAMMCVVGIDLEVEPGDEFFIVYPNLTQPQEFVNEEKTAGFKVPAGATNELQVVTMAELDWETYGGGINTQLDVYPRLFRFLRTSTAEFFPKVTIWVCNASDVPDEVLEYLMLGHQHIGAFKLLEPALAGDAPEDCPADDVVNPSPSSSTRGNVVALTSHELTRKGVTSGNTGTFSDFVPTDRRGNTSSNVGTFSPMEWGLLLDGHDCGPYPAGADVLPPHCRPRLELTTPGGNELTGVTVKFEVKAPTGPTADGAVADGTTADPDCTGDHLASADVSTDGTGTAKACWRLDTSPGTNVVRGTPQKLYEFMEFGEFVNGEWVARDHWEWTREGTAQTPQFDFVGFFSPVKNPPTLNASRAGNTIPVKFSLGGNWGLSIFAAGYPKVEAITCPAPGSVEVSSLAPATSTTSNSALSYDGPKDQYNYTWKTEKSWGNSCRKFTIRFTDGVEKYALFQFSK